MTRKKEKRSVQWDEPLWDILKKVGPISDEDRALIVGYHSLYGGGGGIAFTPETLLTECGFPLSEGRKVFKSLLNHRPQLIMRHPRMGFTLTVPGLRRVDELVP